MFVTNFWRTKPKPYSNVLKVTESITPIPAPTPTTRARRKANNDNCNVTKRPFPFFHSLTLPRQTYIAALEKQLRALKNGGVEPPVPPPAPAGGVAGGGSEGDGGTADASTPAAAGGEERPPQDEEAANAIRLLTKRNQELQAEVEEEKAEVKRRCVRVCVRLGYFIQRFVILSRGEVCATICEISISGRLLQDALVFPAPPHWYTIKKSCYFTGCLSCLILLLRVFFFVSRVSLFFCGQ